MDKRQAFVEQWFNRSEEHSDSFEQFVFLWLAFIVTLKTWAGNNGINPGPKDDGHDGWYVAKFFADNRNHQHNIDLFLSNVERKPCGRKNSNDESFLLTPHAENNCLRCLYQTQASRSSTSKKYYSTTLGRILKSVRNNLFHGGKLYESDDDEALVSYCTPVLRAFVIDLAEKNWQMELGSKDAN